HFFEDLLELSFAKFPWRFRWRHFHSFTVFDFLFVVSPADEAAVRIRCSKLEAGSSVGILWDEFAGEGAGEEGGRELVHWRARLHEPRLDLAGQLKRSSCAKHPHTLRFPFRLMCRLASSTLNQNAAAPGGTKVP